MWEAWTLSPSMLGVGPFSQTLFSLENLQVSVWNMSPLFTSLHQFYWWTLMWGERVGLGSGLWSAWHTSVRQQDSRSYPKEEEEFGKRTLGELGMFILGVLATVFKHLMTCLLEEELAPEDGSMCGRWKLRRWGIKQQQMGSISDGHLFSQSHLKILGLSRWHSGKESACQCRRHKTCWIRSLDQEDPLE